MTNEVSFGGVTDEELGALIARDVFKYLDIADDTCQRIEGKGGTKDTEYRRHGSRWNEDVCQVGRSVVLSKGYGRSDRLAGVITGFDVRFLRSDDFVACYGEPGWAACIKIRLSDQP